MGRIKMTCPVCGGKEFIDVGKPYGVGMDTFIRDESNYYGCVKCGLILRFNKSLVDSKIEEEFKQTEAGKRCTVFENQLKTVAESIKRMEMDLSIKKEEKKDPNRSVKRDQQLSIEIKELSKTIREKKDEEQELLEKINKERSLKQ